MKVNLSLGQEFYILHDAAGNRDFFGQVSPVPVAPINPSCEVWLCESTEEQSVLLDGDTRAVDANSNTFALIVGGRPKCKRRN